MILTHFDVEGWQLDRRWFYMQGTFKPTGIWLSDENDYGWKEWCESEDFRLERLKSRTEFSFVDDANILHLSSIDEVMAFNEEWQDPKYRDHPYISQVDWAPVADKYDGILITPYTKEWGIRLPTWYLSWDVSSACAWNLNVIKEAELATKSIERTS